MSGAIERLSVEQAATPIAEGHVARYVTAASWTDPGDVVMDVACGVGYGAAVFAGVHYHGYDRLGVPDERYTVEDGTTTWHACDLDDPAWVPAVDADVTCCFETLEHVVDPERVAARLARWTGRLIFVSVPTIPTTQTNPYHRHDFGVDDVAPLFPGWSEVALWAQPEERSHVWMLAWR